MRILIVDDSMRAHTFLKKALSYSFPGCNIISAFDGKDALHRMTTNSFDLIITDLEMGANDGQDFIAKLLSNKVLKKKKIVIFASQKDFLINYDIELTENIYFIEKTDSTSIFASKIKKVFEND